MSKRVTCDGPGCTASYGSRMYADHDPAGEPWLNLQASADADHGDYCSWTCLAATATANAIDREGVRLDERN